MFGKGFGWGRRRWATTMTVSDPERAYFGLGPCGEYLYRLYKEGKIERPESWAPGYGWQLIAQKLEELEKKIEKLEKSQ